ncbi:MAG: TolC family outer membrane protein [Gammaproteobacteria bacterium]|nr:TolC family outer membrane protein [Gammaproteobacteria bacterium]MCW8971749.1 TolC family outer membrane protein [Gammaproteobacteria bacterium]MCW8993346.1 TolC family outer membrane protein [Gammaproteobacteria bacterium]
MQRVALTLFAATAMLLGSAASHAEDLLDIYRFALENDPQLRAAEAANRAVQETRAQSRSPLLPQINLSANITENSGDVYEGTGQGYTLSLNQSLYHHDYYVQLRQTDANIARADAEFEATRQGTLLRAAEAYFDLLAAQDNLTTAEASKRAISQQLRQTEQRFEVGLSAITDVHEAQAGYDAAVAAEIGAQNQLDVARENLRAIIGQEPMALATLQEEIPLLTPEPADIDQWVNMAQQQNLALLAAESASRVAAEEMNRRQAGHYPTLDLVANHNYSDTTDYESGGSETDTNQIGLQLNVPIYSGGLTTAQTREARELYSQAMENLELQRRTTIRDTRSAYLAVTTGISQVKARRQALSSAQTALEATQAGFEVGTRTAVDVLNAQQVRFQAQSEYYRARYDYILASLQLRQAAGSLSETDLAEVNNWLK